MRKKIILIGGGPACLIAAYYLSEKHEVYIYEQGKRIGRKFLVAGNGGFNLTNAASSKELINPYSADKKFQQALLAFDSAATRTWLKNLGIPTFVGSSGRVFPEPGIKPIEVLNKLKKALLDKNVKFYLHHTFVGFNAAIRPVFEFESSRVEPEADAYIFGLGGASWSKTGSNDRWLSKFADIQVNTIPFESSNCGVDVELPAPFLDEYAGSPLKNIQFQLNDCSIKGEALLTKYGLEGNAIYPMIPIIRKALRKKETVTLSLDLKPNNTLQQLLDKVIEGKTRPKNYRYLFNLNKFQINLIKKSLSKSDYLNPISFVETIKNVPLIVKKLRPIEEAISTIGGIDIQEVDDNFWLKKHPHIGIIGEMLNWDAPTGGYLLQGCFSTGVKISKST